jgi:hypothetical protein
MLSSGAARSHNIKTSTEHDILCIHIITTIRSPRRNGEELEEQKDNIDSHMEGIVEELTGDDTTETQQALILSTLDQLSIKYRNMLERGARLSRNLSTIGHYVIL